MWNIFASGLVVSSGALAPLQIFSCDTKKGQQSEHHSREIQKPSTTTVALQHTQRHTILVQNRRYTTQGVPREDSFAMCSCLRLANPTGDRAKQAKLKPQRHTAHPSTARVRSTASERMAGVRPAGATTRPVQGGKRRLGNFAV